MPERKSVVTACISILLAIVSCVLWASAAPAPDDNTFAAQLSRPILLVIVSGLSLLGAAIAAVSLLWRRNRRVFTLVSVVLSVLSFLAGYLYLSQPNATTLVRAAHAGDLARVKQCLARGVDVNGTNRLGWHDSPGYTALSRAAGRADLEMITVLLEHGADPNLGRGRPPYCQSPLVDAAAENRLQVARLLLSAGAEPNIDTRFRARTEVPLFGALRFEHYEMADLLTDHGAIASFELYKTLLEYRRDKDTKTMERAIAFLLRRGLDVNETHPNSLNRGNRGCSVLIAAIQWRYKDVVEMLIEAGADVNLRPDTHAGLYPLSMTAELGDIKIVEMLLSAGAEVNADLPERRLCIAPLLCAMSRRNYDVADVLVSNGARPTLRIYDALILGRCANKKTFDETKRNIDYLLNSGLDTKARGPDGRSRMWLIPEKYEQRDVIEYLQELGID